ncbi:hypothetical protein L228DRAFT_9931 [Xylona heveae TC161]|uniref:Casein kinase substrate phosphoprotein PP28 domain-containing protein n=1 Tax=Xylona heveae (strain CBS 132557 / TC161) TaxID=1328760 RepID=A0A165JJM3_XYLHT|nr:hypothetical protein L228DRAFT_9931 [Xylona heveae TC161]KZF26320.1 hypothetical protein L228DRAFT_9931 [Xylona heveae TC161]
MAPKCAHDEEVVDSWEDDVLPEEDAMNADVTSEVRPNMVSRQKPTENRSNSDWQNVVVDNPYSATFDGRHLQTPNLQQESRRPEKQTAVAGRMIAGALGVRAPKKTDEQRAYERAVKEREIKRRNLERQAQVRATEEAEKAKAAIWED